MVRKSCIRSSKTAFLMKSKKNNFLTQDMLAFKGACEYSIALGKWKDFLQWVILVGGGGNQSPFLAKLQKASPFSTCHPPSWYQRCRKSGESLFSWKHLYSLPDLLIYYLTVFCVSSMPLTKNQKSQFTNCGWLKRTHSIPLLTSTNDLVSVSITFLPIYSDLWAEPQINIISTEESKVCPVVKMYDVPPLPPTVQKWNQNIAESCHLVLASRTLSGSDRVVELWVGLSCQLCCDTSFYSLE